MQQYNQATTDRLIELYRIINQLSKRGQMYTIAPLREAKAELRRIEQERHHEGRR